MSAHRKSQRKNTVVKANKSVVTLGPPSPATKFITVAQLRQRWGNVSHMFIERRLKDDTGFPRPFYFGRLRFFDIEEVAAWERGQVTKAA